MFFVEIDLDRIPETFPALIEWIEVQNSLREKPIRVTMVIDDDQAIAVVLHANARILYLTVDPAARRQGVAKAILGYLRNQYNEPLLAHVLPTQTKAIAFFSSQGGVIDGTFIDVEDVKYLRMVLGKASKVSEPPVESMLVHYLKNTPVFVSVADKMI